MGDLFFNYGYFNEAIKYYSKLFDWIQDSSKNEIIYLYKKSCLFYSLLTQIIVEKSFNSLMIFNKS